MPGDPVPEWAGNCPGDVVPPGMYVLRGDHPASEDSKQWGYCPARRLFGLVQFRLRRGPGATPS